MTTEEKILVKVRKMLELANNEAATEAERDNALQMAHDLLAKYELDMEDVPLTLRDAEDPRVHLMMDGWNAPYAKSIRDSVAKLFRCKYYFGRKINGTRGEHHFVGRESAATTAMYMSDWIIKTLIREADRLYKHRLTPPARSFCVGAANRLYHRIDQIVAASQRDITNTASARVLYDIAKREAEANLVFIQEMGTKLLKSKTRRTTVRTEAFERGKAYADTINLTTQIHANKPKELK